MIYFIVDVLGCLPNVGLVLDGEGEVMSFNSEYERYDWGFVQVALARGDTVIIRPANLDEMTWAERKLADIVDREAE